MNRDRRRFGGSVETQTMLNAKQSDNNEESCACLGSQKLSNVLLFIIAAMVTASFILKAVEDDMAGPVFAEGMDHVRYFRQMATWGQEVMHNATMEVVDNSTVSTRRSLDPVQLLKTATTTSVNGSVPEVAVVRELLQLLINTNDMMERVEREGSIEHATALMTLAEGVGSSDSAAAIGSMIRGALVEMQHIGSGNITQHASNTTESLAARLVHIVAGADDVVGQVVAARVGAKAGKMLDTADAMLEQLTQAQTLEYVHNVLTVTSALLQELRTADAPGQVLELIQKADVVLDEARESLDSILGNGLTLSLGGGK